MLTKEQLLSLRPKLKEILIPEWGDTVFIRPLTEIERGKFTDLATRYDKAEPSVKIRCITFPIILWAVCNEDGSPFFADQKEITDVAGVSPSSAFLRLQDAIFEYSAFTKEAREEVEKNLPPIPNDKLSSD